MVSVPELPDFQAVILDDHDFQRRIGARVLKNCGASAVHEAASGREAITLIQNIQSTIDLLLCDLKMPGMDGLEFLRHIAELRSTSSVILASSLEPAILRAAEAMASTYGLRILGVIEKPVTQNKLLPLMLRHFGQTMATPRPRPNPMPIETIIAGIENHQLEPYFQPKVNIRTCKLAGVEALMRWRHPQLGMILPSSFIPEMEANGLISKATLVLIESILTHCRRWHEKGLRIPIAINISVESLNDTNLPDVLLGMIRSAGFDPSFLTIEVTETTAMTDLGHSLETLARFRMNGFGLSIDDYGTGFSSMQQLTRIPFSELKIDQVFVTGSAKQQVLYALLETSVQMAKRLRLQSVAEGIETSEDWDAVARVGCDIAQGYFIARPMPGDELPDWYEVWLGNANSSAARKPK